MSQKRNPEPLAGGLGAIRLHVNHTVDNRRILRDQAARCLRRQHLARQVHALGDRVLFEFIDELDRAHDLGEDLDRRLERYAGLDAELLRALGGDCFPPAPLRAIGGAS